MANKPIVMISSYPPRLCGIGTFCEEAREFIQKANPDRQVRVISHTDGAGVHPKGQPGPASTGYQPHRRRGRRGVCPSSDMRRRPMVETRGRGNRAD
jgi:hypothetical protein